MLIVKIVRIVACVMKKKCVHGFVMKTKRLKTMSHGGGETRGNVIWGDCEYMLPRTMLIKVQ